MKKIFLLLLLLVSTVTINYEEINEYEVCPYGLCFGSKCDNA